MPTDVIFMLDISPSMFARDMDPHRLGRAQQIIQQFILQKEPEDRYALVTFNYNSVVLSYLTRDPEPLLLYFDYLNQTERPIWGTNMGAAMIAAMRIIRADEFINPVEFRQRRRVLVLISDGDDNIGKWEEPLDDVIRRQFRVYTFGLGTANGAPFPLVMRGNEIVQWAALLTGERLISQAQARTLREVAERTGARIFRGEDNRQVQAAIDEILVRGRPLAGYQSMPTRLDLYFHFLLVGFVFMLAGVFW
jgi:Ca-activated chloride channel family protein